MDTYAHLVSTRRLRSVRIPPAAMPEGMAVRQRGHTAIVMRIAAAFAILALMAVGLLIAEPWDALRALLHP